jgi:hypothetical protein
MRLEGIDGFKLVLESFKEEHCVDLLIITSLVGRIDGTNSSGTTYAGSSLFIS